MVIYHCRRFPCSKHLKFKIYDFLYVEFIIWVCLNNILFLVLLDDKVKGLEKQKIIDELILYNFNDGRYRK